TTLYSVVPRVPRRQLHKGGGGHEETEGSCMFFSLLFPVLGCLSGVSSRSDSDHGTCRAPFDP
ncbi:unnamed protein product, partial [Musa acuminata subsp. burmannicoides]